MKNITFKTQVIMVFVIIGIGYLVANLIKNGIAINISWIICGLLYIVNPVYPNFNNMLDHKKGITGARIGGIIIILLALITKNGIGV